MQSALLLYALAGCRTCSVALEKLPAKIKQSTLLLQLTNCVLPHLLQVRFFDLGGHERYSKTMLHGLTTLLPDCVLLCVSATAGADRGVGQVWRLSAAPTACAMTAQAFVVRGHSYWGNDMCPEQLSECCNFSAPRTAKQACLG